MLISWRIFTDRIAEAWKKLGGDAGIVINVQGDEPLIPTSVIDELIELMKKNPDLPMATVAVPGSRETMTENNVKVVFGADGNALYFSRSMIPFLRRGGEECGVWLHWGIYAYRAETLARFVALPPGKLENAEKLEQLRALWLGGRIAVVRTAELGVGVDRPEDVPVVEALLRRR